MNEYNLIYLLCSPNLFLNVDNIFFNYLRIIDSYSNYYLFK